MTSLAATRSPSPRVKTISEIDPDNGTIRSAASTVTRSPSAEATVTGSAGVGAGPDSGSTRSTGGTVAVEPAPVSEDEEDEDGEEDPPHAVSSRSSAPRAASGPARFISPHLSDSRGRATCRGGSPWLRLA
ncbi:hypothetical protein GCM10022245_67440 [Streptomyces mayteni]